MGLSYPSRLLLLLFMVLPASAGETVHNLPGYGDLEFTLETGYIGVDQNEQVQLFYYFVESQTDPQQDPIMLWINGGPGCSSLYSFVFENGPLSFDIDNYDGRLPTLVANDYSWTKAVSIIYLDGPVGTGFSYSKTPEGYAINDTKFAANTHEFIVKWFMEHQTFRKSPFYIGGEGYSGNPAPMVLQKILDGPNDNIINVKGYVLGNPGTDQIIDFNSRVLAAHYLALIPEEVYQDARGKCNDSYFPAPTDSGGPCALAIQSINKLVCHINPTQSLDPSCSRNCSKLIPVAGETESTCPLLSQPPSPNKNCKEYAQNITETWANTEAVQEALHVKKGRIPSWKTCNNTMHYDHDISSVISYYQNFICHDVPLRGLIYSGDHDLSITYVGTLKWINSLDLNVVDEWRQWCVGGETAGYTREFQSGKFSLRFVTVKGAGHFAALQKPQSSAMMKRWMAKTQNI